MGQCVAFGAFTIDRRAFHLLRKGKPVPISASLFKLLLLFTEQPGALINREQIAACLWGQSQHVDVANGINTAVNRLRVILGDNPAKPIYLETVVGAGYRFKAPVEVIPDAAPPSPPVLPPRIDAASTAGNTAEQVPPDDTRPAGALPQNPTVGANAGQIPPMPATASQRRPVFLLLFAVAAITCLGGGLLFGVHRRPAPQQTAQLATPSGFAEVTFNDQANRVTAQAISRSGHRLAYSDRRGLFIRDLPSSQTRSLTLASGLHVVRLAWSQADAGLLVSGLATEGEAAGEPQVWSVPLDGQPAQLLLRGASDAVASPDGKRLAYIAGHGTEVWVRNESAAAPRRLYRVPPGQVLSTIEWSPGADRLILQDCKSNTLGDGAVDLQGHPRRFCSYQSLHAQTGALLALQPNAPFDSAFLMADGRLYFSRDLLTEEESRAALFVVRTDPASGRFLEAPQLIARLPGDRAFRLAASDGGRMVSVLLQRRSSDIFVGDLSQAGAKLAAIRHLPHVAPDNYPHAWTADGSRVIYESNETGDYAIYEQGTHAPEATLTAQGPRNAVLPQLSPDHRWILFEDAVWKPGPLIEGMFRIPAKGGGIQQVPLRGRISDFRCPVTRIPQDQINCVVRENVPEGTAFYRLDPQHGEGPQLAIVPASGRIVGDWSVSSDGTLLAIAEHDPSAPGVRLIDISGKRKPARWIPVRLAEGSVLIDAAWSPAGDGFYSQVRTGVGYELQFISLTGHATPLRQTFVPTWGVPSPDGRKLAFVDQTSNTNVWVGALNDRGSALDLDAPSHSISLRSLLETNK